MRQHCKRFVTCSVALALVSCQGGVDDGQTTAAEAAVFDGISKDETIFFSGTEPFWGGEVWGGNLRYTTPEDAEGQTISVQRFAGLNGLGFSGTMHGAQFDMMVTPGECSDGMSDAAYPFTITLKLGDDQRYGCGWTETQPVAEPEIR